MQSNRHSSNAEPTDNNYTTNDENTWIVFILYSLYRQGKKVNRKVSSYRHSPNEKHTDSNYTNNNKNTSIVFILYHLWRED